MIFGEDKPMIKEFFGFDKSTEKSEQTTAGTSPEPENATGRLGADSPSWEEFIKAAPAEEPVVYHEEAFAQPEAFARQEDFRQEGIAGQEDYAGRDDLAGGPEESRPDTVPPKALSVIAKDACVIGDIITEGHIEVDGKVKGDINAKGNVAVQGVINGGVTGEKVGLYECRIKGDIKADIGIVADSETVIVGDVQTKNIILDGKLKGNITADDIVVLRSNAYYIGDVITDSLSIEAGAVIDGSVKTRIYGDPEAPFDD
jgi:cytoskeletal protein CcmA (bactofilin family)